MGFLEENEYQKQINEKNQTIQKLAVDLRITREALSDLKKKMELEKQYKKDRRVQEMDFAVRVAGDSGIDEVIEAFEKISAALTGKDGP